MYIRERKAANYTKRKEKKKERKRKEGNKF